MDYFERKQVEQRVGMSLVGIFRRKNGHVEDHLIKRELAEIGH